jgi:fructokinase
VASPIVIWGEILWDRLPSGSVLGGAPANCAWHLAMLGAPVALASRVGDDDDGREAIRRMAARGVDVSLIQVDPERATGEVGVVVERGEPRYRLAAGRAWERIEATEEALRAIRRAPAMITGTLAQRTPAGLDAWFAAMGAAAPALKVVDVNLRGETVDVDPVRAALDLADVVKVGGREQLAIERALGKRDLVDWLLGQRSPAARLVAVTRGPEGATLHGAAERVVAPACRARPGGDNIGCGDAYVAVLTHGLLRGWPLGDIALVASRWAAEVASVRGATPDLDAATIARLTEDRVEAA